MPNFSYEETSNVISYLKDGSPIPGMKFRPQFHSKEEIDYVLLLLDRFSKEPKFLNESLFSKEPLVRVVAQAYSKHVS